MEQPNYIDPGLESELKSATYSVLSPGEESLPQDVPQGAYEEMEYDTDEMNRNPPPLWKPPPSPTSTYSIIYSRVERGKILDPHHGVSGSPRRSRLSPKPELTTPHKPLPKPPPYKGDGIQHANKPHPLPKQKNVPPTKPKVISPTWNKDQNLMKNVLNDPSLVGKLHEKRQELYGAYDMQSISSCESPNPMENYEEICFDLVNSSSEDENASSHVFSRVTNMTLPPRRHNIGSEVAMLQCPADEKKAQAYLSFQPSPSHSPHHSVCESELSTSEQFSPRLSSEGQPPLPPRGAERMREGSPRLVRKPLPAIEDQSRPPELPARPRAALPAENEELLRTPHLEPFGQHAQPPLSSSETPPTPPIRNASCKEVSPPPQPPTRRHLHVPMPLPKETNSSHPQPPLRQHHQLPTVSSDAPPVPVRQSNTAGGVSHSTNDIGDYPPSRSMSDDDAPPVPSRGARQRDIHPTPSLQRPHSTPSSDTEPQVKPRPPIRPTHVGEVHSQQPAPAWDGVANMIPPVTRPRPPVASKPHPPPVSAKPTKPPPNAKPPASAKTAAVKPPLPTARKPVHVPRTVPSGQQNGAPPLPPR